VDILKRRAFDWYGVDGVERESPEKAGPNEGKVYRCAAFVVVVNDG
jgi:hypothetical protein